MMMLPLPVTMQTRTEAATATTIVGVSTAPEFIVRPGRNRQGGKTDVYSSDSLCYLNDLRPVQERGTTVEDILDMNKIDTMFASAGPGVKQFVKPVHDAAQPNEPFPVIGSPPPSKPADVATVKWGKGMVVLSKAVIERKVEDDDWKKKYDELEKTSSKKLGSLKMELEFRAELLDEFEETIKNLEAELQFYRN